ncbi:hypothetical protein ACS0TY_001874 [Phlomoides rotata]
MVADRQHTRVNTQQIKYYIYKKIGPEKANDYFILLGRFLNLKMSKIEFDKSCIQIIGRENIYLHNHLIHSIVRNAKIATGEARKAEANVAHCVKRSHLQSLCAETLPQAPRKCRSSLRRGRSKYKDRSKSPSGPFGKSPSIICEETVSRLQEQHSGAELRSFSGRQRMVEDGEEVEQCAVIPTSQLWTSVTAPVGVSLNMGGDRRGPRSTSLNKRFFYETCQSRGELPDTKSLGRRLQEKLGEEGVGISRDGANLLNKSLDVYLKKIISQCVGITGARRGVSGFNEISPGQYVETPMQQQQTCVRLLDFRVAMESNPTVLGEDWHIQLEKICNYSFQ